MSLRTRGKVFNACVRSALLHGSETWAPTAPDLQRLHRNDRSMVRWICGVRDDDEVSSDSLCAILGVQEVTAALRTRRLRCYGHVAGSSSCINSITSMTIPSARRRGRPKKTWSECVKTDMKMCSLGSIDPLNREAWGLGVRHSKPPAAYPNTWDTRSSRKINSGSSQVKWVKGWVTYGKCSQLR